MATAADTADPVKDLCDLLAAYLPRLRQLLPDPDSPAGYAATGLVSSLAHSPLPGNAPALLASTTIACAARWWKAMLLYHHGAADPWRQDGMGDDATAARLRDIVQLAAGADNETVRMLLHDLALAEAAAAILPAIDEAQTWRRIRGRMCRHCRCYFVDVLLDAGKRPVNHIECRTAGCRDADGRRPVGEVGTDGTGRLALLWADGTIETAPDLDAAA